MKHPLDMTNQRGMTLVVVLIMLVLITIFTLSMIRLTKSGLMAVGNMQAQQKVENAVDEGIAEVITKFTDVTDNVGEWPVTVTELVKPSINNVSVKVDRPKCFYTEKSPGYSELDPLAPDDTHWDIPATGEDTFTGAKVEIHEGIKFRALAGACP